MANTIKARVELGASSATLKFIITHPMAIERRDPKTNALIEAHFIEEVNVKVNGEQALALAWGQAISTNPYFSCALNGVKKGDTINIAWRDNKNQSDTTDLTVG